MKKKCVHEINGENLILDKDYINEYFYSIFTDKQNYLINKKQVFFVSKIYEKFFNLTKENKLITLNNLNNRFNLTKNTFKKSKNVFTTRFYQCFKSSFNYDAK